jgi:YfiH family protein
MIPLHQTDHDLHAAALVVSPLLEGHASIRHGVTGRLPGEEPAEGNIGYTAPRDPDAAWLERQRWSRAAGIDPAALTTAHQVHGRAVLSVGLNDRGNADPRDARPRGRADGLITATPGVALMTLHADCLPIILADPALPAVGVVHAGWRGTVVNAVSATVDAMQSEFGADPARMVALLGPAIRSCCYEVGDEVVEAWRDIAGDEADIALAMGPRRSHFDLVKANVWLLQRSGIASDRIDDQAWCTQCNGDRWFSHRAQGPETGRFAAIAGIAPDDRKDSLTWF